MPLIMGKAWVGGYFADVEFQFAHTARLLDSPPVTDHTAIINAELTGFGQAAGVTGGSAGPLITVTNLANSGAGSLRQAIIDASGPRWIRFSQGLTGTINHTSQLLLNRPDITIDGRGADIAIVGPSGGSNHNIVIKSNTLLAAVMTHGCPEALGDSIIRMYSASQISDTSREIQIAPFMNWAFTNITGIRDGMDTTNEIFHEQRCPYIAMGLHHRTGNKNITVKDGFRKVYPLSPGRFMVGG